MYELTPEGGHLCVTAPQYYHYRLGLPVLVTQGPLLIARSVLTGIKRQFDSVK